MTTITCSCFILLHLLCQIPCDASTGQVHELCFFYRDILQSELISEIQQSSVKQLSSTISHEDTESDLMLHFLASIKEQKQQRATKLVDDIKRLESGISEIESRWPNNTLTFPKPGFSSLNGSRLINNINQRVTESGQHEVLRSRKNNIVTKQHIKTMGPQ
ncbi:hypothetical protein HanRHA438_Chr17g0791671 [Helianthus annuus]|uniref:Uncharacterized protein n=1 Tax=Helianthus annuus TaxID=4232 RepID=A0A9K3DF64_HELAN|nr:hypothetical protein HanXRQr2_Chr17g0781131 [Helianthus annuus]KAJ0811317.1 hypothetical protein HanPSC8_Chr17g0749381 [Helianthus annuus]KAJ0824367.1 hypothetical protein HanRHA438_Chr17g0791671 [Helianthus annuus]